MYVSSRLTSGLVFAVVLALALWTFGVPSVQARAAQGSCYAHTCEQRSTPPPTQSCLTCPVDQKEIKHQQHEAEEAAERQAKAEAKAQKEAEHAQHEAAEECHRQQKEVGHARYGCGCCPSNVVIERAKPEPVPEPIPAPYVAPMPEPMPVPEAAPAPMPAPMPEPVTEAPKELPKTASPMGLIGLVGLLSMSGYLTQFFRR